MLRRIFLRWKKAENYGIFCIHKTTIKLISRYKRYRHRYRYTNCINILRHTHLPASVIMLEAPRPSQSSRNGMFTSRWISSLKRDSFFRAPEALRSISSKKRKMGDHWEEGLVACKKMRSQTNFTFSWEFKPKAFRCEGGGITYYLFSV